MRKLILVGVLVVVAAACGETAAGPYRDGTGGGGGTEPLPAEFDVTCRAFCANEPEGSTCGPSAIFSSPRTVQECYEWCVATVQGVRCREEWIAQYQCHLDLECDDVFGDCARAELDEVFQDCEARAENRELCVGNCPHLDPASCELDTTECETFIRAKNYCETDCPTQGEGQCIDEYEQSGTCSHEVAVRSCRNYCAPQDLEECVSEWLSTGECEFTAEAACSNFCPGINGDIGGCIDYWNQNGECPPPGYFDCQQTCGVGNATPNWSHDEQALTCSWMGIITLGFSFDFQAQPQGGVQVGANNSFNLSGKWVVSADTATSLGELGESVDVQVVTGEVVATAGTSDNNTASLGLNGTPCTVCFNAGEITDVQLPQSSGSWVLNAGSSQELTLEDVTFSINAAGLDLVFSTTGSNPACAWDTVPPSLTF